MVCKHLEHKCLSCGVHFANSDSAGTTVGNPLAVVFNDLSKMHYLNFTHRAAHGGADDGDV